VTSLAAAPLLRRGACPGLSAPMPTGDGLLVRLRPIGTISLATFRDLCGAAQRHGNGVIEVTARGSIQVRGLSEESTPRFADAVASLGIAAEDGAPVIAGPLAGLDLGELIDASALAAKLRSALSRTSLPARVAPKVSVVIDGGGALSLDALSADVRLRAELINNIVTLRISVGGDAATATLLGTVMLSDCTEAAIRLLEVIAQHGPDARARDVLAAGGIALFHESLPECLRPASASSLHEKGTEGGQAIGLHRLRDGSYGRGIGLAFGHSDATALERLASAAEAIGANGVRVAAGRVLIVIGLGREAATAFSATAEHLGFITRTDDPRRHVVACAGAPICASAHISSRAMAPSIAQIAAPFDIHVSGCAKGCAHPRPAAMTIVGTPQGCALVAGGTTRDPPFAVIPSADVPAAIARYAEAGRV
jgi:precorrin-3B synthase